MFPFFFFRTSCDQLFAILWNLECLNNAASVRAYLLFHMYVELNSRFRSQDSLLFLYQPTNIQYCRCILQPSRKLYHLVSWYTRCQEWQGFHNLCKIRHVFFLYEHNYSWNYIAWTRLFQQVERSTGMPKIHCWYCGCHENWQPITVTSDLTPTTFVCLFCSFRFSHLTTTTLVRRTSKIKRV